MPGTLSLGFDNNFRMTSQTVNGTALAFGYDLDGLLTGAGALTLTRDPQNGRLTGTTLGLTDRLVRLRQQRAVRELHRGVQRDPAVLRERRCATPSGGSRRRPRQCGHDARLGVHVRRGGRLTDVTEDGNFFSHYGYDADDNRTDVSRTRAGR